MDPIVFEERLRLRDPVIVCAFSGWNDAGESASGALDYLRERWASRRFAWIDPEEFYDFQVNRPTVRLEDGLTRRIEWPKADFHHASLEDRDVILFQGIEPSIRWRTYCEAIVGMAKDLGAKKLVTLGGFLADLPHTRAIRVTGSASNAAEAERLGMSASRYEGPTGVVGVLHDASNRGGLPSVSLWAAVPHYLPSGPNPKASLALVERLSLLIGAPVPTDVLLRAVETWAERIDGIVAENAELTEYVERLESSSDEDDPLEIPSGEELARELEHFLRGHGEAEPPG
jgi:predicted ATP-grasp superfamily ATP-dependent carboligase